MSGRTTLSAVMPIVPSRQRASLRAQRRQRRPVSNRFRMHAVLSLQDSVPSSQCLTRRLLVPVLIFCFPPPQQRPASGPNAVRRVGHLNAVHKGARLRHRNLDKEQRTIVLVSGVSFSCKYFAIYRSINLSHLEQSAVFFASPYHSIGHCLISEVPLSLFAPAGQSRGARYDESVHNGADIPSFL
jgi:hypothetical protein